MVNIMYSFVHALQITSLEMPSTALSHFFQQVHRYTSDFTNSTSDWTSSQDLLQQHVLDVCSRDL